MLAKARNLLKDVGWLVYFPEGQRSKSGIHTGGSGAKPGQDGRFCWAWMLSSLILLPLGTGVHGAAFAGSLPSDPCFSGHQLLHTSLVLLRLPVEGRGLPWSLGKQGSGVPWGVCSLIHGTAPAVGGQVSLGSHEERHKTLT